MLKITITGYKSDALRVKDCIDRYLIPIVHIECNKHNNWHYVTIHLSIPDTLTVANLARDIYQVDPTAQWGHSTAKQFLSTNNTDLYAIPWK